MNVLDHFGVGMCYISHITMSALGHSIRLVLGRTCHCWASSYDSLFLEIMPTLTGCSTTDIQSVIPFIYLHLFIWNLSFIMSTIVVFFVGQGTKLKCCSFKEVRHAICFFLLLSKICIQLLEVLLVIMFVVVDDNKDDFFRPSSSYNILFFTWKKMS